MDFGDFLKTFGLEIPSVAYIVGAVLFGIAGIAGWRHGRKLRKPTPKWLGVALMLYPYAVPETWLMYLVGTALSVWLYFAWD